MIDAHQHFWIYEPVRDGWITEDMAAIRKDFLPPDLKPILQQMGVEGTVLVQVDQSEEENDFMLKQASAFDFIKGVVGWVDLRSPEIGERLAYYKQFPKMKGYRHILQGEQDRALMLKPSFKRGIALLGQYGFTYDILIYPDQLGYTGEFVAAFPDQPFVIDHIAKPHIRDHRLQKEWQSAMRAVGAHEHVFCKLSGMVTEADWYNWKAADFRPYLDVVVEVFGTKRIMFGSDWPVCQVAGAYADVLGLMQDYFAPFSLSEREAIFDGNARAFYHL